MKKAINETKKAISVVEYSLFIAVIIAAILGMQFYLKRAICGRWKETGDVFGFGRQYDPQETAE